MSTLFGRYHLIERLAMGGMAEIWYAHLVGASGFIKELVIKRIHREFSEDPEFVEMFINEANIIALLNHKNIIQVSDFDEVDGHYYIAMEYVKGLDLKKLFDIFFSKKQFIPINVVLWVIIEALNGVHYAHQYELDGKNLGIIHRDISPTNILLSLTGEVKLSDFGIAYIPKKKHTSKNFLRGKIAYMAPEQTRSDRFDAQADLFSMGVVLWELLTNHRLFQSTTYSKMIEMVRSSAIPDPRYYNEKISKELSDVVMWALNRPLDERIPDARTFRSYLKYCMTTNDPQEELNSFLSDLSLSSHIHLVSYLDSTSNQNLPSIETLKKSNSYLLSIVSEVNDSKVKLAQNDIKSHVYSAECESVKLNSSSINKRETEQLKSWRVPESLEGQSRITTQFNKSFSLSDESEQLKNYSEKTPLLSWKKEQKTELKWKNEIVALSLLLNSKKTELASTVQFSQEVKKDQFSFSDKMASSQSNDLKKPLDDQVCLETNKAQEDISDIVMQLKKGDNLSSTKEIEENFLQGWRKIEDLNNSKKEFIQSQVYTSKKKNK